VMELSIEWVWLFWPELVGQGAPLVGPPATVTRSQNFKDGG
jgi:hypothetical protein